MEKTCVNCIKECNKLHYPNREDLEYLCTFFDGYDKILAERLFKSDDIIEGLDFNFQLVERVKPLKYNVANISDLSGEGILLNPIKEGLEWGYTKIRANGDKLELVKDVIESQYQWALRVSGIIRELLKNKDLRAELSRSSNEKEKKWSNGEPELKVGDWIITNVNNIYKNKDVAQVTKVKPQKDGFYYEHTQGGFHSTSNYFGWHLWTKADIRHKDILVAVYKNGDELPFVFKDFCVKNYDGNQCNLPRGYCGLDAGYNFICDDDEYWNTACELRPANFKQRWKLLMEAISLGKDKELLSVLSPEQMFR